MEITELSPSSQVWTALDFVNKVLLEYFVSIFSVAAFAL